MRFPIRFLTLATWFAAAVFGTARFSGEEGARAHRTRLSAGQQHTCTILDDGTVDCWGHNNYGQLGDGTVTTRLAPVPVTNLGTAISIAAGSFHTCAILSTGVVRCWGFNDSGQLGNGTTTSSSAPVPVSGLSNVVALAVGFLHTCAVRVDGTVWCWGAAVANGSASGSTVPVKVNLSGALSVTAGANHTCALMANSQVECWGQNSYGQLGNGDNNPTANPAFVLFRPFIPTQFVAEVSAGSNFTCMVAKGSEEFCWGDNSCGQFGNGSTKGLNFEDPTSLLFDVVALATGGAHTCTIRGNGTVSCFGLNDAHQLGSTTFGSSNLSPVPVPNVVGAIEIAAGAKHTCASLADGTIRCWGDNTYGQHGDGSTGQVGIDAVLDIGGTFLGRGVTAGNQFPCGRRGNGAPACWGAGGQGQLGDSSNVSSTNPVAVTGITAALAVATGGGHGLRGGRRRRGQMLGR